MERTRGQEMTSGGVTGVPRRLCRRDSCQRSGVGFGEGEQGAEQHVLHDGELAQHLRLVHLDHARIHLRPAGHATDVIQHRRSLAQRSFLHVLDEPDGREVEVVIAVQSEGIVVVDGGRPHCCVPHQLRAAPEEGQELVVVQAPHPMAARRLQPVGFLHFAHEGEVAGKHSGYQRLSVISGEHPNLRQAIQQRRKCRLMSRAVVDARRIAKRVGEVQAELLSRRRQGRRHDGSHQGGCFCHCTGVPGAEGRVAVPQRLCDGWDDIHPPIQLLQHLQHSFDSWRLWRGISKPLTAHSFV
mmetsp:Transcript_10191/g.30686  ORF Transcript_10191/g.30686 Transcript_10191/m.30686 type:complete len:298 (+) Transcript_10191:482-1375(+)